MKNIQLLICLCIVMTKCLSVRSQSDNSKLEVLSLKDLLNTKITTASKNSEELDKAAATVIVITEDQIRTRGYQSLLDVLQDLPDVKVDDKLYMFSLNNITMRGVPGQDKFIILLDGVRISSPTNEAMPIFENYPVNLAHQIEVVYGPASALYGADAVSGVINIITKKNPSRKNIQVEGSSGFGTNNQTNSSLFIAKKIGDHANLVLSGQFFYDQQPDYTKLYGKEDSLMSSSSLKTGTFQTIYGPMTPATPVHPQYEAPMSAYNIYAALHLDEFSIAVFSNYSRTPSTFGNNTSNNVYNKEVFLGQHVSMANISYKKSIGKITSTSTIMASEYLLDPGSNSRTDLTSMEPAYFHSRGDMVKVEEQADLKMTDKLNFTGGVSYTNYFSIPSPGGLQAPVDKNSFIHGIYRGTQSFYRPGGLCAQFNPAVYNNTGTYIQVQYAPRPNLNFTVGTRFDINSRYGNSLNPRLGVVYKPFDRTTIKLLYGSAFLAPSPSDAFLSYGSFETADSGKTFHSLFMHLPNPGLMPIRSYNLELSIRQYVSDNLSVDIDGYYSLLTNLRSNADDNQTTHLYNNTFAGASIDYVEVTINEGKEVIYGGSLQVNYKNTIGRAKINAYASFSYTGGHEYASPGEHAEGLELIAPQMVHLGIDLRAGKFSFSPRLTILGRQNLSGLADSSSAISKRQTIAGYALLSVSLKYNLSKKFSVFMNIHNALNQNYRSVGADMDLNKKPTESFYGQHEDPIRIMGGFNFSL